MSKYPGLFITFEGGEGAGKSHHIHRVGETLSEMGKDVLITREPGGTEEGAALRRLLTTGKTDTWEPMSELLIVTASRVQHVTRLVLPALEMGKIVLCDRYVHSTLAYQGAAGGIERETILKLHEDATNDLWPDFTVILDIDPRIGIVRSRGRLAVEGSAEDRFEKMGLEFHERVRGSFLDTASRRPERHLVVDASRELDQVHEDVLKGIFHRLAQHEARWN